MSGAGSPSGAGAPVDTNVPTGGTDLAPEHTHLMLSDLAQPLRPGQHIDLTLTFARNGTRTVGVKILSWDQVVERNDHG